MNNAFSFAAKRQHGQAERLWQGALWDPQAPEFASVRDAIAARRPVTIDLLYGDHEGGQRMITRFSLSTYGDTDWLASVSHHWSMDRSRPR